MVENQYFTFFLLFVSFLVFFLDMFFCKSASMQYQPPTQGKLCFAFGNL